VIEPPKFYYEDWFCTLDKLTIVSAPPGVGKTYFCLELAMAMSRGDPFLGKKFKGEKPLKIAYIDMEMGSAVMLHRLKSLVRGKGLGPKDFPDGNFNLYCEGDGLPDGFQFASHEGQQWLESMLEEVKPDIVIADPLINLIGRVEEKDNRAMNEFFLGYVKRHGCHWIICHHESKGGEFNHQGKRRAVSQRMRGATSIEGNADRVFSIIARTKNARLVEFGKSRHWTQPEDTHFEFTHNPARPDDHQWLQLNEYIPKA
jgi:RecA-family ATPase